VNICFNFLLGCNAVVILCVLFNGLMNIDIQADVGITLNAGECCLTFSCG